MLSFYFLVHLDVILINVNGLKNYGHTGQLPHIVSQYQLVVCWRSYPFDSFNEGACMFIAGVDASMTSVCRL